MCDISRQLLSHVSSTELMRTIHRPASPLLIQRSARQQVVAHDKTIMAQNQERLSVFQAFFFIIIIVFLFIFSPEPLVILVFVCVRVLRCFCCRVALLLPLVVVHGFAP